MAEVMDLNEISKLIVIQFVAFQGTWLRIGRGGRCGASWLVSPVFPFSGVAMLNHVGEVNEVEWVLHHYYTTLRTL